MQKQNIDIEFFCSCWLWFCSTTRYICF